MQKSIQMFIVWILPFFGAILIAHFNTNEKVKLAGIYKQLSLVSRFVAMIFFIKLYSKKESNAYGGGLAVDDMGWREGSMSHESFGDSGGGDA
jgi:NAD-dependent oxidoreductase involved in siderophore biosynthesis